MGALEQTPDPAPAHRRVWQTGGVTVVAVLVVAIAVLALRSSSGGTGLKAGQPVPGAAQVVARYAGLPEHGTHLGRPTAPSTLILYADPQCPFCGAFERTALPDLVEHEVRAGMLQVELRPLTFIGEDSARAARMLLAAGEQDRLWPLAELMARFQGSENTHYVTNGYLRQLGGAVAGLDVPRALRAAASPQVAAALAAAKAAGARDKVRSTPWILVGPTGGHLTRITTRRPSAATVRKALA